MNWYVYMVHCFDGTLYTGVTNDLDKRIKVHNAGSGAKYTASRLPVVLVWHEESATQSAALKREIALKKLSRAQKLALIGR